MRVLQINAVYGSGSTGRMVKELHEYLKKNSIESFVACAQGCDNLQEDEYRIGNRMDVRFHSLMARGTGLQGYFSYKATSDLLAYIKRCKPDIVHLGNLHSNYVNVVKLLRFLGENNIATVLTLHDCWFYTGKCSHYTVDECSNWKQQCGNCVRLKKDIPSWFFDRTRKMLKDKSELFDSITNLGVIGVSQWITDQAKQSILKKASIIRCVYNWIDLNVFRYNAEFAKIIRQKHNLNNKFIILGVSNLWNEAKGVSSFIKISKLLKENEVIVLVGECNCELPEKIISIPPTSSIDELVGLYSAADVFLQMSLEESFGKVVAEAMACGTPVITNDSTANAELVTEKTGYVCHKGDIYNVIEKIRIFQNENSEMISQLCREYATNHFDMHKQLVEYMDVYRSLLER